MGGAIVAMWWVDRLSHPCHGQLWGQVVGYGGGFGTYAMALRTLPHWRTIKEGNTSTLGDTGTAQTPHRHVQECKTSGELPQGHNQTKPAQALPWTPATTKRGSVPLFVEWQIGMLQLSACEGNTHLFTERLGGLWREEEGQRFGDRGEDSPLDYVIVATTHMEWCEGGDAPGRTCSEDHSHHIPQRRRCSSCRGPPCRGWALSSSHQEWQSDREVKMTREGWRGRGEICEGCVMVKCEWHTMAINNTLAQNSQYSQSVSTQFGGYNWVRSRHRES